MELIHHIEYEFLIDNTVWSYPGANTSVGRSKTALSSVSPRQLWKVEAQARRRGNWSGLTLQLEEGGLKLNRMRGMGKEVALRVWDILPQTVDAGL